MFEQSLAFEVRLVLKCYSCEFASLPVLLVRYRLLYAYCKIKVITCLDKLHFERRLVFKCYACEFASLPVLVRIDCFMLTPNHSSMQSVMGSQCPKELEPADPRTKVDLHLFRRDENYSEPKRRQSAFQGVGRTLGSSSPSPTPSESTATAGNITTAPAPSMGLVVDTSLPTTSIQLRLSDGTRMISRFNHHHTIRDIRGFIDASQPGGATNYQLQTMGFPPKQLTDLDQTIEQAGIANSVVIQKY
ncbi:hypothetical protein Goari_016040 [Gossypium aridum]|uniref:UBX domain-containing protein n=1 Tax=Gossypium aridum TaxID=34290 RepID=A0A7J8WHU8_GOSAI|nr:hypothetical protein [Gossypium aridum]